MKRAGRGERQPEVTTVHSARTTVIAPLIALALFALAGCGGPSPSTGPVAPVAPAASAPSQASEPARTPALSLPPPQEPRVDASPSGGPTPVPGADARFPPEPACPGPATAPDVPDISASVGDGDPVPGRLGSFSIRTCSTSGASDLVGGDPETPLLAQPDDELVVTVATPWRVAQWAGSDRPVEGESANTWPLAPLPTLPRSFTLGLPPRSGDSILSLDLELVSDDGRAVASIPVSFLVRVAP